MKILLVNTYDKGGAANACIRLHIELLKNGVDSKLLLLNKSKSVAQSYSFVNNSSKKYFYPKLYQKFESRLNKMFLKLNLKAFLTQQSKEDLFIKSRHPSLEMFSYPNSHFDITQCDLYKKATIINLHWVAGFLDFESFFKKNTKPVIWTLHDMNPFTGGEHYLEKFVGVDEQGCPAQRTITLKERAEFERNLKIKRDALENSSKIEFIALCKWMLESVKQNTVFRNFDVHKIPNGLNNELFVLKDKYYARKQLNLPQDKKIILFIADSLNKYRKGYIFLLKSVKQLLLTNDNLILCSVGSKSKDFENLSQVYEIGFVNDINKLNLCYAAADVFVIPSIIDNLPNTVLESLYCGTPVIGFPVGGIPDMIRNNKNGILTTELSVNSLTSAIQTFVSEGVSWSREEIRNKALLEYSSSKQVEKYLELFKSVIQE